MRPNSVSIDIEKKLKPDQRNDFKILFGFLLRKRVKVLIFKVVVFVPKW